MNTSRMVAGVLVVTLAVCVVSAGSEEVRWVAPEARGSGDGATDENAAQYTDAEFWRPVQAALEEQPVTVRFLRGDYVTGALTLDGIGHPDYRLTIEGDSAGGTSFKALNADDGKSGTGFFLRGCQNVTVRYLNFTGPGEMSYISQVQAKNILFEHCTWIDLPNMKFGATGTTRDTTEHVAWKSCTFKRVGVQGGAHMIYNAYGPQHVYVIDCIFEDCAGDYVRWRDHTDYSMASGCTFRSTGTWPPAKPVHATFISIPLFADKDPGDEWFGTHFVVRNNKFIYEEKDAPGARTAISFLHRGFDPPGRHHLMTPEEGAILEKGAPEEKKALLKKNCNIDTSEVCVFGNVYENVLTKAAFSSGAAYGAESKGWQGTVDIFDLLNHESATPGWVNETP